MHKLQHLLFVSGLSLLVGCAAQEGTTAAPHTTDNPAAEAGPLTLATGFGTARRTGQATGTVKLDACKVWIGQSPDLSMTLNDQPMGNIRIRVRASEGVEPVVRFSKGTFCARMEDELPTVARGAWSKDTYEIYIGVPAEGQSAEYALEIVEK